jgi:hypothetical protein
MTPASPTHFIGIDPGLTGGIALYVPDVVTDSRVWAMPFKGDYVDGGKLVGIFFHGLHPLDTLPVSRRRQVVIELVHSRPRQAGSFNFGLNTGIIHGVLGALNIPFQTVAPQKWKPAMGLQRHPDEEYKANKERSRLVAIKLFPHLANDLKLKKDDGKAEALLLAVYAAHQSMRKDSK